MHFPLFTLATTNMIQANINSQTYFFTVNHITKETSGKLIYGISINNIHYFLSKTSGINDGAQLDNNTPFTSEILKELDAVITEIELKYKKRQTLENINREIFSILIRLRSIGLKRFKKLAI
ncbi:MAG: hypothetical protein JWQ34_1049 [Mucilaginibacter sp.]|uniref:hypothetical protein n=1 Tax=Mucilaginibacter sp. TaxID=1882438 RepID=UPI002612BA34|nr:hypothetical protein [Mucilaginibacter sp.]MDB5002824.1 hypothetical protein [Mucilaginibacter sp.]